MRLRNREAYSNEELVTKGLSIPDAQGQLVNKPASKEGAQSLVTTTTSSTSEVLLETDIDDGAQSSRANDSRAGTSSLNDKDQVGPAVQSDEDHDYRNELGPKRTPKRKRDEAITANPDPRPQNPEQGHRGSENESEESIRTPASMSTRPKQADESPSRQQPTIPSDTTSETSSDEVIVPKDPDVDHSRGSGVGDRASSNGNEPTPNIQEPNASRDPLIVSSPHFTNGSIAVQEPTPEMPQPPVNAVGRDPIAITKLYQWELKNQVDIDADPKIVSAMESLKIKIEQAVTSVLEGLQVAEHHPVSLTPDVHLTPTLIKLLSILLVTPWMREETRDKFDQQFLTPQTQRNIDICVLLRALLGAAMYDWYFPPLPQGKDFWHNHFYVEHALRKCKSIIPPLDR